MLYGLYLSAQGAQVQTLRQEVVSNNLANASTASFKRDLVTAQAHLPYDVENGKPGWVYDILKDMPGGVTPGGVATDFSQGDLTRTGNIFDVGIQGKGFLRVSDGKKAFLTRDGHLAINQQNQLVTRDHGLNVLNTAGQMITGFNPELPIEVQPDGSVTQGDTEFGKLALVEPRTAGELSKAGRNLYTASGKLLPVKPDTEVRQGYIENSGISPVAGMVELIESARVLEANVNMIHYQDDSLSRLLDSLPRK